MRSVLLGTLLCAAAVAGEPPRVTVTRLADGCLQPQASVDDAGATHLLYFKGDPKAGDLFYSIRTGQSGTFGEGIRVNSVAGAAVATGTIRGGQLALGRGGRVHVVWNGSRAVSTGVHQGHPASPLLYSRLDPASGTFEPQRDLMGSTFLLDGGGSVAADADGRVAVVWHASPTAEGHGESERRVFVARSSDDGATFAAEAAIDDPACGVCACCGLTAGVAGEDTFVLYRAAKEGSDRDMVLLKLGPEAASAMVLDRWSIPTCPMTSGSIAANSGDVWAAGETRGQVWAIAIDRATGRERVRATPPGVAGTRKHPRVAAGDGSVLLVWTDGTGWNRGGAVVWQAFDAEGKPIEGTLGRAERLPAWSFAAALARPDGSFEILY